MTTKPVFIIEISMHSMVLQRAFFDNEADALKEHDILKSLMGKDPYDRFEKNKKDGFIHTVNTPSGPLTLDTMRVEAVRMINNAKWNDLIQGIEEASSARKLAEYEANLKARYEMAQKFKATEETALSAKSLLQE